MNFSEHDSVSAKQRIAGEEIQPGTEIKKRSRLITTAAEVCFQLLTRDAYHLSINGAIRLKHQIPIARVLLVQREVDHIRFELNTGGGGTQTSDALELEIELLMNVTVNYRPGACWMIWLSPRISEDFVDRCFSSSPLCP